MYLPSSPKMTIGFSEVQVVQSMDSGSMRSGPTSGTPPPGLLDLNLLAELMVPCTAIQLGKRSAEPRAVPPLHRSRCGLKYLRNLFQILVSRCFNNSIS